MTFAKSQTNSPYSVGIIGGGVAGTTIAMRLSQAGISVSLFEANRLISGPPICHLHAGGNLYREIPTEQCQQLLEECIDMRRAFPHVVNERPTVIAIPKQDAGDPNDLLPRLHYLQQHYQKLVDADPRNQQLGDPQQYFQLVERADLEALKQQTQQQPPQSWQDWMIPLAKHLDLDKFKFPFVLVQEYGLSLFRFAATAVLSLENTPQSHLFIGHKITQVEKHNHQWRLTTQHWCSDKQLWETQTHEVDYLINAAGFQTGKIDDLVNTPKARMVEFKAAYVTHWQENQDCWPEVIIHGERGTPQGMAQLTPYANNHFQLHGMTHNITLFNDGLAHNTAASAQPQLPDYLLDKIQKGWKTEDIESRTQRAIQHVAQYLPKFDQAHCAGKPLFGAQQVPGEDITLRATQVSFVGDHYARAEIVKATSALAMSDEILAKIAPNLPEQNRETDLPITQGLNSDQIYQLAETLAVERGYPAALAQKLYQ